MLKEDEGGRKKGFLSGYQPQLYLRTSDQCVTVKIPGESKEEKKLVMPGDNVELEFTLMKPLVFDKGMRFAIREGGRTVSAGIITEVLK